MKSNFFDADAHNAAMQEMADEIKSGGLGERDGVRGGSNISYFVSFCCFRL